MTKESWKHKSGFEKTKDEVFELMLAEAGAKVEKKERKSGEEQAKDRKWKEKSGFQKTKDQIAELMIIESNKHKKIEGGIEHRIDPSEDSNLIRARGTAFMAEQQKKRQQQMMAGEDAGVSEKYVEKEFTDSKTAREMCAGTFESSLEVQTRKTTIKIVAQNSREEHIVRRAKTGFLGKYQEIDLAEEKKLDLEMSRALHAEVHFRSLGYKIDFN